MVNTVYIFLLCSIAVTVLYAIVISHRIAGPMLAIRAFIKNMKDGRYDEKRSLRPYDELSPIMDDLHELADALKAKR
jgi:signal transduction histidine kinase